VDRRGIRFSGRVRGRAIGGQAAAAPHPVAAGGAGNTPQDGRCRNILTPSHLAAEPNDISQNLSCDTAQSLQPISVCT
jgi:hypothetical protein